ncbi:MAG: glycosyltransferase family 39 protein, partial [Phycisphaerales bacterium]
MHMEKLLNRSRLVFWATVLIFFLMHLYKLSAPPNGYHQFRESDTAAIALNYYQEDMSFLKPRVNQRGTTSGIAGSELPLYNYSVALVYSVLGPSHAWARLLTILAACVSLWLLRRIITALTDRETALFSVWAMAFSPLFFFYSFKIMPDIWMLTLLLGAILGFVKHLKTRKYGFLLLSSLCLILSASIKPLGLSVYLVFLYLVWREREGRPKRLLVTTVYALVTFAATYGWFVHARSVNEIYGGSFFYMGQGLPLFWEKLLVADFYKKLILQWPFELWIGYLLVPAFIYGCYRAVRERGGKIYLVWLAACYIVFALVSSHSYSHDYYTLIIIPPLAAVTGLGLKGALRSGGW